MQAHAQILMSTPSSVAAPSSGILADETATTTTTSISTPPAASQNGLGKRVLNVGFGLGIVDSALQEWHPSLHIIIEAHPDVYQRMMETNWHTKTNVRICFGTWQTVLPQLIAEGTVVDAIFFDTVRTWSRKNSALRCFSGLVNGRYSHALFRSSKLTVSFVLVR